MNITCVTIDCSDPKGLAEFWNGALGWGGVTGSTDSATCGPVDGGAYLEFVRVTEAKVVKNRVHLGCSVGSLGDLDSEVARLLSLGATVVWEEQFPPYVAARYRNIVLRDPEGNEFCLGAGSLPE